MRIKRPPDFVIGGVDDPYMLRWYLLPRNRWFNIYLHKFLRSDDDRALHDHPWPSLSLVLCGCGIEHRKNGPRVFRAGDVIFRGPRFAHQIEIVNGPIWTLFIRGPKVREWGFHCPQGWRHWREFVQETDEGNIGKGCD